MEEVGRKSILSLGERVRSMAETLEKDYRRLCIGRLTFRRFMELLHYVFTRRSRRTNGSTSIMVGRNQYKQKPKD
jgi:hypothetical protein